MRVNFRLLTVVRVGMGGERRGRVNISFYYVLGREECFARNEKLK